MTFDQIRCSVQKLYVIHDCGGLLKMKLYFFLLFLSQRYKHVAYL